ncbi:ABC transporter permease [Chitinasiproducens palmae]|uniref:Peptide/nickel transport system permease protein n=1 Tax=Chitinasiproducens palmae TaxID=1770053 RepID=A0A1H2PR66_9BURK|nr:ABC transporter permease [Chitinasiproducens palmae]SDV49391.1 peptide/nickel transport system permease protein [Chitinasiproducens palmae]
MTTAPQPAPGQPDGDTRWRTSASRRVHLGPLARAVGTRLALAACTLALLAVCMFLGGQLLPGDIGRAMLGPFADAQAVAALNHRLGVDQPLITQFLRWAGGLLRGDLGRSYSYDAPVASLLWPALCNSLKLAGLAFAIVVPLGIAGGVVASLYPRRWPDRLITVFGLAFAVVPEFVSAIVLILVFAIGLRVLPVSASFSGDAGFGTQFRHLLLPALPLVFVLFAYLARITRTGMREALDADFTRTAVLKGLPLRTVLWRHVLRNALAPALAVAATQLGYMVGGLVVVETIFHYRGIGSLVFEAARAKDFPMLEAGVLTIGVIYVLAGLLADALQAWLDPRQRKAGR